MRLSGFICAALATLTIASPIAAKRDIVARDANEVVASVQNIEDSARSLQDSLSEAAPGQVITSLIVLSKSLGLSQAVESASDVVQQQPVFNLADSTTIALAVTQGLYPQVVSLVNLLIVKKPAFKAVFGSFGGDFTPLVKLILQDQKSKAGTFASQIIAILDPSFQAAGQQVQSQLNGLFDQAITVYSS